MTRLLSMALLLLAATTANAQPDYPNKPVKIIVNVAAGGGVDTATRIVAQRLSERLGQNFVIENRPGAGGNLGAEVVYHAPADGYTLLASSGSPLAINGYLYRKMNYEMEGFEVISVFSQIPNVLVVRPNFPAKDGKEFLAYVRANPGKVNYASQGASTASHLTGEMLNVALGLKMTHVPYKGTAPALNDLIAGHVDITFIQVSSSYPLHQSGKARILLAATEKRIAVIPDIPTFGELGVPGIISRTYNALSAPPKTPLPVLAKLNAQINEVLAEEAIRKRFAELQLDIEGGSLEHGRRFVAIDRELWGRTIKAAGIKLQE
ncbi:MAG: tripartite tricarboxylate transporter substrate binding protein [Hyphomicrobiales bacterium]|nr:tripartite tricarboxylate transporter substrate binding protein [Hyphomicrobiales bacterium]